MDLVGVGKGDDDAYIGGRLHIFGHPSSSFNLYLPQTTIPFVVVHTSRARVFRADLMVINQGEVATAVRLEWEGNM